MAWKCLACYGGKRGGEPGILREGLSCLDYGVSGEMFRKNLNYIWWFERLEWRPKKEGRAA